MSEGEQRDDLDEIPDERDSQEQSSGILNSKPNDTTGDSTDELKLESNYEDFNSKNQDAEEATGTRPDPNGFFSETKSEKACSVCVAVRVRPLIGRELVVHERVCVECNEREKLVIIGKEKGFKFDRVFDQDSDQEEIFDVCTKNLILG